MSEMQREGHCMSAKMPDNAGPNMTAFVTANRPSLKRLFRALPIEHNSKSIASETTEAVMITCNVNDLLDVELKLLWNLVIESVAFMVTISPMPSICRGSTKYQNPRELQKTRPG